VPVPTKEFGRTSAYWPEYCLLPPTPLAKKVRLSRLSAAGDSVGKTRPRLRNVTKLLKNLRELEPSTAHHILITFQSIETLLSGDFESPIDSILCAHSR
jgi:hypothetical protein